MRKTKEILIQKIKKGIVKPFSSELIKLIKPAIRIIPEQNHLNEKPLSKFGGVPLIKKGEKWPRTSKDSIPYAFLLQLNLEEINRFDIENRLPSKGILSFWFNLEDWVDGKVIYNKHKDELEEASLPLEIELEHRRKKLPFWKRIFVKENNFKIFPEHPLKFEVEYHTPSWDSLQMRLFHILHKTKPRDLEIDERYIDEYIEREDHHLFGYYVGLQESIYELTKINKGRYQRKISKKLIQEGLKWQLLLQIDTDDRVDMSWVDGGKILFFIQENDLIQRNFNNLIVQLDTT